MRPIRSRLFLGLLFSPFWFWFRNFRDRPFILELLFANAAERMRRQTFLEQIAIDGLGRGGALAGGDDHLAISRRNTARGIKPRHSRAHAVIDLDLAVGIELRAEFFRQLVVKNVAARRKEIIDLHASAAGESERADYFFRDSLCSVCRLSFGQYFINSRRSVPRVSLGTR